MARWSWIWAGLASKALSEQFMRWMQATMPDDSNYVGLLTGPLECDGDDFFEDEDERLEYLDLLLGAKIWEGGESCS